jgi:hypothetical protein
VIKKEAKMNKAKIECPECREMYCVMVCVRCKGYFAIKNFMSGFPYECSCKYCAMYLLCNKCNSVLVLPANKNFEKTKLKCRACGNLFRYKICGTCRACIYKPDDDTEIYLCSNQACPGSGSGQQGAFNPGVFDTKEVNNQINNRVSQFEEQASNQHTSFKDICKVCVDREATMINTCCYHLALCESCAKEIERKRGGECPICRTKGTYQRVFKP